MCKNDRDKDEVRIFLTYREDTRAAIRRAIAIGIVTGLIQVATTLATQKAKRAE